MKDIEFLKEITDAPGGSGDEGFVREILRREISKVTEPIVDGFGNIYGKVGNGPVVLANGHMDEIGFMVREITPEGKILVFNAGFVFPHGMTCQIFQLHTNDQKIIEGVMTLNTNEPMMEKYPNAEGIMFDIGAQSKEEVEALGIEIGNNITPKSHFTKLQNTKLMAKAWDNRIGCTIAIRALQEVANKDLKVTYIGGGSVQEEVGCRGALAMAVNLKPSIALSFDTSPAGNGAGTKCGDGPQLFVMDSSTIANKKLLEFTKKIAKENNIPYQLCLLRRGGTDTDYTQNMGGGAPALAIGIPVKNIHTPTGIIDYNDYDNAVKLLVKLLEALDEKTVEELRTF